MVTLLPTNFFTSAVSISQLFSRAPLVLWKVFQPGTSGGWEMKNFRARYLSCSFPFSALLCWALTWSLYPASQDLSSPPHPSSVAPNVRWPALARHFLFVALLFLALIWIMSTSRGTALNCIIIWISGGAPLVSPCGYPASCICIHCSCFAPPAIKLTIISHSLG